MTDFKIPDTPDTDSIWDRMGNEWQRKVYDTKKVWMCVETESVRSWIGLLDDFGPLTNTPPVPKVGDILTEKTAFRLPSGSIVMANNHMAMTKRDTAFYVDGQARATWDALQRPVRYEPIRVVRVGWSS